jgi:glycosyltransferase involved in cell wall biosynthesis
MLSVIIPTRQRADLLEIALDSLQYQNLPLQEFEVIVVDNCADRDTRVVVDLFQKRLGNVRYIKETRAGFHTCCHRGVDAARGEILVFTHDDFQATETWLSAIAENFREPHVALVGGNNFADFKDIPPPWLTQLWEREVFGGHAIPLLGLLSLPSGQRTISPHLVWSCNLAIRKQAFHASGGFRPDYMPPHMMRFRGDGAGAIADFILKEKLTAMFDSRASVYHAVLSERMTINCLEQRAYSQGMADSYSQLRYHDCEPLRVSSCKAYMMGLAHSSPQLTNIRNALIRSYRIGFAEHQQLYRDDAEVREWVHKPHYR